MDFKNKLSILKTKAKDVCLANSATIHIIVQDKKYLLRIKLLEGKVNIISSPINLIANFKRVIFLLTSGIKLIMQNDSYSTISKRNLLRFKDIHRNGYHIKTLNKNNVEYLCTIKNVSGKKYIENLWSNHLLLRLVMNLIHFYKEFKKIYMDHSIHQVDHFITL